MCLTFIITTSYSQNKCPGTESIIDYDGNIYNTVQIGIQCWMKENLKTTHYSDGSEIELVEDETEWIGLSYDRKAYCYYENDSVYGDNYGALYTWAASMNGEQGNNENPSGIQGICPNGWHLPSDNEWMELELYLGMSVELIDTLGWRGNNEGKKLKDVQGWYGNGDGTNITGFTAKPAGVKAYYGTFLEIGKSVHFWVATENETQKANVRWLYYSNSGIARGWNEYKNNGLSVRCINDNDFEVSVDEKEYNYKINVYPNPMKDIFWIEFQGVNYAIIKIYTVDGKKMLEKEINSCLNSINLTSFDRGIYLLKIQNNDFTKTITIIIE